MGVKSTIEIGRRQAIDFIISQVNSMDDKTLENIVEDLNDHLLDKNDFDNCLGLHNFVVVDDRDHCKCRRCCD